MKEVELINENIIKEKTISIKCDFCQEEMIKQKEKDVLEIFNIEKYGSFNVRTNVNLSINQGYPECINTYKYTLDVCAKCFKIEILNRAKNFKKEESDY